MPTKTNDTCSSPDLPIAMENLDWKTSRRSSVGSEIPKKKKRRKEEEDEKKSIEKDMLLSLIDLPDEILLHVLSFLNSKEAVQTCLLLSKRWNHLWKHLPTLTLTSSSFKTLKGFTKFVHGILSLRDEAITLHALDFQQGNLDHPLFKRIVSYAVSHQVQRLRLDVTCDHPYHFQPFLLSCQTLTSLTLSSPYHVDCYEATILLPYSMDLPLLTTLNLHCFGFLCGAANGGRAEPFLTLNRLNTLILSHCVLWLGQILCISSTTLVNFTIIHTGRRPWYNCKFELYAPCLCNFAFTGTPFYELCGSNLSSIQKLSIDAHMASKFAPQELAKDEIPLVLLSWLIQLTDVKYLTLSTSTLQVLSLVPDLLKVKFLSLCNLKSLEVKNKPLSIWDEPSEILKDAKLQAAAKLRLEPSSFTPDEIVNFLRQNSPSAKFAIGKVNYSF